MLIHFLTNPNTSLVVESFVAQQRNQIKNEKEARDEEKKTRRVKWLRRVLDEEGQKKSKD